MNEREAVTAIQNQGRYKLFRNFMMNELGVTRADIEEWTKAAVSQQAERLVNNPAFIEEVTRRVTQSVVNREQGWTSIDTIRQQVASGLLRDFEVTVQRRQPEHLP